MKNEDWEWLKSITQFCCDPNIVDSEEEMIAALEKDLPSKEDVVLFKSLLTEAINDPSKSYSEKYYELLGDYCEETEEANEWAEKRLREILEIDFIKNA